VTGVDEGNRVPEAHDVIVAGGGLVGAVTALGLARTGRRVLLVDRSRPRITSGGFDMDIRNIACSPGSRKLLEELGIWSDLLPTPYRRMEVWEERGVSELSFEAAEVDRQELGWILENSPTVCAIWEKLEMEPSATIVLGDITGITQQQDCVRLTIAQNTFQAGLLVGVDGARSTVRSLVGASVDTLATGHQALATLVRTEKGHSGVAYQRFLLDGPLALLPSREEDVSSVVWSQPPDKADQRLAASDDEFCSDLGSAIEHRLGRILEVDVRLGFPLQQHVVKSFNPMDRVLLIGDAARVLHPLAGLGANIGFEDARDLLKRAATMPMGADLGASGVWRAYARKRRVRAQLMVAAMAGFKNFYAGRDPVLLMLRNSAVGWINGVRPIKRQLILEALGMGPLASTW